jgi:hypothetical protein
LTTFAKSTKRLLLGAMAVVVVLAPLGWVGWHQVIDSPRPPAYGAPAASVADIDQRLRPYQTDDRYVAAPLARPPDAWPPPPCNPWNTGCDDQKYSQCQQYKDSGTPQGLPTLITAAGRVPAYHGNVRVRAGWPPVRVRVWVAPDVATARDLVARATGAAYACRGRQASNPGVGEVDGYSLTVARYARSGWSGSRILVDGEYGDDSQVFAGGGGTQYVFGTVLAARERLVAELKWGAGEPRFYQFGSGWIKQGDNSVDAILTVVSGTTNT